LALASPATQETPNGFFSRRKEIEALQYGRIRVILDMPGGLQSSDAPATPGLQGAEYMEGLAKLRLDKVKYYVNQLIPPYLIRETVPATDLQIVEPADARYDCPPDGRGWRKIDHGGSWGAKQQYTYFRGKVTVPSHWKGNPIELRIAHKENYLEPTQDDNTPAGPEGQAFIDGRRVGALDRQHQVIRYPFQAGQTYDVRAVIFAARCRCRHCLEAYGLQLVDAGTYKLYHDMRVALEMIDHLDVESLDRARLLDAIDAAIHELDTRDAAGRALIPKERRRDPAGKGFYASVPAAQKAFDRIRRQVRDAPGVGQVLAVGHAHIDLGWLWPIRVTHHKCVRTYSTQVRLLKQYPDWVFQQSSPQTYKWLEQDAPDLLAEIRKLIKAGRWEADGATWCECDMNVTGAEALVRQFLYGKRYFKDKLGVDSRYLWLPDVFGYSAALPQLLNLADCDAFITSKISWNEFNRFPYDTFRWRGLDGSEIPVQFITTACDWWFFTYNSMLNVEELKGNWKSYQQKGATGRSLLTFGFGDGGGGPTERMLETGKRLADEPTPAGLPKLRYGRVVDLVRQIKAKAAALPVWDGELYLELHRGTYTTQGWIKRANRKNEIRLHNLEWLAALGGKVGYTLDKPALDALWEDLLLMQFHDILPGSSVGELYDETRGMHEKLAAKADRMTAGAAGALAAQIDTSGAAKPVVLFNTLSWDRTDPVRLPDGTWLDNVTVPAGGWTVVDMAAPGKGAIESATSGIPMRATGGLPASAAVTQHSALNAQHLSSLSVSRDGRRIESRFWRIKLDRQGRIAELFDRRANRQVLPKGAVGNLWQVYEDRSAHWDAWDIPQYYTQHPLPGPVLERLRVVERGSVRVVVEMHWKMPAVGRGPQSTITQKMVVYASHPRIDFETRVDWHEHHAVLKAAFPVDVRATEATYQVQWGHLARPTHTNTSWDIARFEVPAHRFADLAEHGYGVALLNDCKYGYHIEGNLIRLTCLRSPTAPHALADQGLHEFTYSLLPHAGSFQEAGVIRAAAELNVPVIAVRAGVHGGALPATFRFVECTSPAVVIETVKPAEDGNGTIVRLYESHGSHAAVTLRFADAPKAVETVNLLEQPYGEDIGLETEDNEVSFGVRPFQIVTLRVR
jgi:alpha-mannosidase